MAKIKHNNFFDTVDEVIADAKREGVVHLYAEDEAFTGRKLKIKGKDLFHFGTTGYLGLEQDQRLKNAAVEAILKYGTQFPLSKTYISHPLYKVLEEKIYAMYGYPVIITKNSTLGHMCVIPCVVRDEDGIILDHQVHWSVQNAAQVLKIRGVPLEMIRHNNLSMLEDKIKSLSTRCKRIWYMADGVYSMYGDCAPIAELMKLCNNYPQLYLYFDDAHGMSWVGKNGTGYVLNELKELPDNILLFGTLSKTFGASGAVLACSDEKIYRKIKNFGGPLTFSAQLEPASVAAGSASADIHLSPEIYSLQSELFDRIHYFNSLLEKTDLPLMERNDCPVFYIGTGMPATGYNFVNRLMNEGFFVNLGLYPAVPVKNTGVRITISRHNQKEEIKDLVDGMMYHYPRALEETNSNNNRVKKAFGISNINDEERIAIKETLAVQYENSIRFVDKIEWNRLLGKQSSFDWDGLLFLEETFRGQEKPEHNWLFHYFVIRDENGKPVLATFCTYALWKDDILAPESVSIKLEEKRKHEPYYLTSYVLSMGSLFTEGQHYYLDKLHPQWRSAISLLLNKIEALDQKVNAAMIVLRDFVYDEELNQLFHNQGFVKVEMPESCIVEDLSWNDAEDYIHSLSARSRRHFRRDIQPYEKHFDVIHKERANEKEIDEFYNLYENVRNNNYDLNTFSFPKKLFSNMSDNPHWEFIVLYLKKEYDDRPVKMPVGVMFCYKNMEHTYVPAFIGMDYTYNHEHQIYRQMLFQTIKRAKDLNFKKINFGMTASFEKKKVGAIIIPKVVYVQAKDNFAMELLGVMQNQS